MSRLAVVKPFTRSRPSERGRAEAGARGPHIKRADLVLMVGLILVATFLRVYRLSVVPPALSMDGAFNGLDALRVLRSGQLPIFFPENGDREPLFIYLQTLGIALWGTKPWVLSLVSAIVGTVTVPIIYRLGRALFASEARGRYVGIAAAAALTVSYWHLSVSRIGFRVILLPATSALALWFFWLGWRNRRPRDFLWSGLALGISAYTYVSARALPFVLVAFVASLVFWGCLDRLRKNNGSASLDLRGAVTGLGATLGVATLIVLPLALHYYAHPEDLTDRTSSVALLTEGAGANSDTLTWLPQRASESLVKVARMFIDRGDLNPRHNLPGRPALDALSALGFFIGVAAGITRFRAWPVYHLLFLWTVGMILPSVLSTESPHFLRTLGALPPVMILAADGLTRIWERLTPRVGWNGLILLILLFGGVGTFRDYFDVWANHSALSKNAFDVDYRALADQILSSSEGAEVLLPLYLYGRSTLQFYLADDYMEQKALPQDASLPKPLVAVLSQDWPDNWVLFHKDPTGKGVIYFLRPIPGLIGMQSGISQSISDSQGRHVGLIVPLSDEAKPLIRAPIPDHSLDANFGNMIRLVGYDVSGLQADPGQIVRLALYWQPIVDIDRDYRVFVHLLDPQGVVQAQFDTEPLFGYYTTGLWRRGTVVTDSFPLRVPANIEPGNLSFEVGWVTIGGDRLPLLNSQGQAIDDKIIFGRAAVSER